MRGQPTGIGAYCRNLIRQGFARSAVLKKALEEFPSSIATQKDIYYYEWEIENGRAD